MLEHVRERVGLGDVARLGQQVDDDLGVGRALEDVPVGLVLLPEQLGVDQVPVVRHGHLPERELPQQRLGVGQLARPGRAVADVPDRPVPGQFLPQQPGVEHLGDEPMPRCALRFLPVVTAMPADSCPRCCWANRPW
jgi:hypothetical protein